MPSPFFNVWGGERRVGRNISEVTRGHVRRVQTQLCVLRHDVYVDGAGVRQDSLLRLCEESWWLGRGDNFGFFNEFLRHVRLSQTLTTAYIRIGYFDKNWIQWISCQTRWLCRGGVTRQQSRGGQRQVRHGSDGRVGWGVPWRGTTKCCLLSLTELRCQTYQALLSVWHDTELNCFLLVCDSLKNLNSDWTLFIPFFLCL